MPKETDPAESIVKSRHKRIALDILSAIAVIYAVFVMPIWAHYQPDRRDANAPLPLMLDLLVVDILPCALGACWLSIRYLDGEKLINPGYRLRFIGTSLLLYFTGYLVLKFTIWQ